ncbi:prepilin peptidase [Candidatus Gottesmanbacteria bacterium]|nr:prepilin peptidase [Candidatus Gottesmanbacteria bacterium]
MELIVFLSGLAFGSFANVLIDRGDDVSVLYDRSRCDFCKRHLSWYELIPVFSFLFLRGQCRTCRKKLSLQYPLVELCMGLSFVGVYSLFPLTSYISLVSYLILTFSFVVIFIADLKYFIIPDSMIILSLLSGFFLFLSSQLLTRSAHPNLGLGEQILEYGIPYFGTGLVAGSFFLLLWIFTKGKGMGFGDVKLAFVMGLLLKAPKTIVALYVAFLTGALYGVILILGKKKSLKSAVAFGPFLILGFLVSVLFGEQIIQLWQTFV